MDAGKLFIKGSQISHKKSVKRRFAGADGHDTVYGLGGHGKLVFRHGELFKSDGGPVVKLFSLIRQSYALVGTDKETAAPFVFQLIHGVGHVRLVAL